MSQPVGGLQLTTIIRGLCSFREMYKGHLDLQMMFTEMNEHEAKDMAGLARIIKPDQVELNTPLRPSKVGPLSKESLAKVQEFFSGMNVRNVYDRKEFTTDVLDNSEVARRGRKN
jgi:wyosine [tRNA(Phe)-imidazoG37] synthetase (radical SAM superfamily)